MGSSSVSRSNLLARNWLRVNNLTYRNVTTNELINEYRIQYQSDEQLLAGTRLLMKRANINHPNIVKLIYFCQDNTKGSCRGSAFSHRLYLEHCHMNLRDLMTADSSLNKKQECICCPIINGLFFLAQTYGHFLVKYQMIWVNEQTQNKSSQKRSTKVWINSQLNRSECEVLCNEQKMCQRISEIYTKIFEHHLCSNPWIKEIGKFKSLQQILNFLFQVHQTSPQMMRKQLKLMVKLNKQLQTTAHQQQNLQKTSNRSYSTYVKEQNLVRRDNSIVANNFTTSNKKIVPVTSEIHFRNLNRPSSPSVKINFLFAPSSTQQINNLHKPKSFLPAQIPRPQSNLTNNHLQHNERPSNQKQTQDQAQQQKSKQNQTNILKKELDKKDQLIKDFQLFSQSQKSIPAESNQSSYKQQSQKQSCSGPKQIKTQYIAQFLSQKQIANDQSHAQKFKNVFQQQKITDGSVSQFNLEHKKHGNIDRVQNNQRQELNLASQLNKTSTISKTYSSKPEKEQLNRSNLNQNNHYKINKQSHHLNDPSNIPNRHQRTISHQGYIPIHRQSQTLANLSVNQIQSELQSAANQSQNLQFAKQINPKLANSKQVRQNRKKLQKIQLQKDLQHQKQIIKKQMAMLLKSNMMSDDSNKIKERVNNKKATFAQLKAEAAKILDGFGF